MTRIGCVITGAATLCALLFLKPVFADTITWQEQSPTNVNISPSGSGSSSYGNGTDTLLSNSSAGGSSYSFSAVASATFNYTVTWVGIGTPKTATIVFHRYGANYTTASGYCGTYPNSSGSVNANAYSTALHNYPVIAFLSARNPYVNISNGSTTLSYVGDVTYTASMSWDGSAYVANFAIPCSANVNGNGYVTPTIYGCGASASANFKQVVYDVSVAF